MRFGAFVLIEDPGQIVTRERLQQRLWPDGTIVEYEHSVSAAMNRLRAALGDSARDPLFIETLPGKGYRFIAPWRPVRQNRRRWGRRPPPGPGGSRGAGLFRR
jgi:DNA-binding winged helix-turn-helix (wHTH) protein